MRRSFCSLLGRGQQSAVKTSNDGREELSPPLSSVSDEHGRLWATSLPVCQLFHSAAFSRPPVVALPAAAGVQSLFRKNSRLLQSGNSRYGRFACRLMLSLAKGSRYLRGRARELTAPHTRSRAADFVHVERCSELPLCIKALLLFFVCFL